MSAMTGIWDFLAMAASASSSSWDGTATRTMSQPVAVSSAICCRVASMSAVSVVVIVCTDIWAPPPTATEPTLIWRDVRRGARTGGGGAGIPRETVMCPLSVDADRAHDVRVQSEQGDQNQHRSDPVHHRQHLSGVDEDLGMGCLLYTSPSPRDGLLSR